MQGRWPFYVAGVLGYVLGLPILEVWLAGHPAGLLVTIALAAGWSLVRAWSDDAACVNVLTDYQRGLLLLDLTAVPKAPPRARPAGAKP